MHSEAARVMTSIVVVAQSTLVVAIVRTIQATDFVLIGRKQVVLLGATNQPTNQPIKFSVQHKHWSREG